MIARNESSPRSCADSVLAQARDPWLAVGLSVLAPGLGQLYARRLVRGVCWFSASMASTLGFMLWVLSEKRTNPLEGAAWFGVTAVSQFGSWVDAYIAARPRQPGRKATPNPGKAAALSAVFPGLGQLFIYPHRWHLKILSSLAFLAPAAVITAAKLVEPSTDFPGAPELKAVPLPLVQLAGAAVSAAAILHGYFAALKGAGALLKPPRLGRLIWAFTAVAWLSAQLPWEAWLRMHVRTFEIPSSSMEPTLLIGDRLWAKRTSGLARGDMVIFNPPDDPGRDYIKRIVALPGETVKISGGKVYVDGRRLPEPYAMHSHPSSLESAENFGPSKIPPGRFFLMGDNRDNSRDSRFFGPVPESAVFGKAYKRYWPLDRAGALR